MMNTHTLALSAIMGCPLLLSCDEQEKAAVQVMRNMLSTPL